MKKLSLSNKIFFYWMPAFFWAGLIFYLSSRSGLSAGFETPNEILFRKIVHMFEFGTLAFLLMRIIYETCKVSFYKSILVAFSLAVLYAFSDELHQVFVSDRNGNIKDVIVDSIGIYMFLCFAVIFYKKKITLKIILNILLAVSLFLLMVFFLIQESIEIREKRLETSYQSYKKDLIVQHTENKVSEMEKDVDDTEEAKVEIEEVQVEKLPAQEKKNIPQKIQVHVPFSSQAPFGIWDELHEESCEEMSLIMVKYYLDNKELSKETAEAEIQGLKDYQLKKNGHYVDSSMEELVEIAEGYYGMNNLKIIYDFDEKEIKNQLALGNPIILPTAGRLLGNPNFTQPGPLYHNIVATGYNGETIITNDPGTRKGEDYKYSLDVLYNAVHDFPGNKKDIEKGRKAMIVIK